MDGYQCLDATIVISTFWRPYSAFPLHNTYSQGGLQSIIVINYYASFLYPHS